MLTPSRENLTSKFGNPQVKKKFSKRKNLNTPVKSVFKNIENVLHNKAINRGLPIFSFFLLPVVQYF